MDEVRAGRLLVATPMLGDPNFKRTVVLVVEDEPEEGTLGVVLNRPTKVPVGRVLEPWTEEADEVTGHRTIAPILVGAKGLFLPDELLPGLEQLRRVPCAIRECRPGTPDCLLG